jgi:hypothetical protein
MNMKDLQEEFEYELEKLTRLVTYARDNNQSIATDGAIIAQSRKVDALIDKLIKFHREEEAKKTTG